MAKAKAAGAKAKWQAMVGGPGYMGISLHSPNHKGDGLAAMVDWMNEHGQFSRVRVGLSDTLNRFNHARENRVSLKDAFAATAREGSNWLAANRPILDGLSMPHELVRWSHWLENHAREVEANRHFFDQAYQKNSDFKASVDADIAAFLKRKQNDPAATIDPEFINTSRQYLIEELAVYSVILKDFPATTVYPGKQLNCFAYMRENVPQNLPAAIGRTGFIRLGIHGLDRQSQDGHKANVA